MVSRNRQDETVDLVSSYTEPRKPFSITKAEPEPPNCRIAQGFSGVRSLWAGHLDNDIVYFR